ncbi:ATP-binding protein [Actinocorallia libanotica]|uniref:Orc1-like AAA ATPase domain-containing protein n=1 Tax=Actinocorallia libanotica TaxID=46162 RepID=A0ABN1RPD7_9ACTN
MWIAERAEARKTLVGLVEGMRDGGGAALVTGAGGMGKSTLLHEVRERAEASGATVLAAVAAAAEKNRRLGVIEQLVSASEQVRTAEELHLLVQRLAERTPVLVTVDDVHECDTASLEFLRYLVRRAGLSRVLVVLGERSEPSGSRTAEQFLRDPRCALIRLAALSVRETAEVLGREPGGGPSAAPEWHRISGGNPLLLRALLQDSACGDGPEPGAAFRLAVRCLLDGTVSRTAHGLGLLDGAATPPRLDRLLALPPGTAEQALAGLDALGLTESGRYRAEAVRKAVLETFSATERAELEHQVARLLHEERATATSIARHLVAGGSPGAAWGVPILREAAGLALLENDVAWAITCLRTAYDACEDHSERATVRSDLAQAEWEADPAAVLRHLPELLEDQHEGRLDTLRTVRLIGHLMWHGRPEAADGILSGLDGGGEAARLWFAYAYPVPGARYRTRSVLARMRLGRHVQAVDPHSDGALVLRSLLSDGPTVPAVEAAERLLQELLLHAPPVAPAMAALASFVRSARLDEASTWCEALYENAEARTPAVRAILAAACATVESRRGVFDTARERADEALSLLSPAAWGVVIGIPLAAKALACTAQDDHETAAECFRVPVPEAMFEALPGLHYCTPAGSTTSRRDATARRSATSTPAGT